MSKRRVDFRKKIRELQKHNLDLSIIYLPPILGVIIILFIYKLTGFKEYISAGLFVMGFTGIIAIIRKEVPIPFGYWRGKWMIFQNVAFTVLCWGLAIFLLIVGI